MPSNLLVRLSGHQLSLRSELSKKGNKYPKEKGPKVKDTGAKGETA
jgi:hypothetical protein